MESFQTLGLVKSHRDSATVERSRSKKRGKKEGRGEGRASGDGKEGEAREEAGVPGGRELGSVEM